MWCATEEGRRKSLWKRGVKGLWFMGASAPNDAFGGLMHVLGWRAWGDVSALMNWLGRTSSQVANILPSYHIIMISRYWAACIFIGQSTLWVTVSSPNVHTSQASFHNNLEWWPVYEEVWDEEGHHHRNHHVVKIGRGCWRYMKSLVLQLSNRELLICWWYIRSCLHVSMSCTT